MNVTYKVDNTKLGVVGTIKLIRATVPTSIENTGTDLIVRFDPQDILTLSEALDNRAIQYQLVPTKEPDSLPLTKDTVML